MKPSRAWGIGVSIAAIAVLVISSLPVSAQGPVGDALATLAAATLQVQQTRQAQDALFAAQRGTATAIAIQQMQADREAARQAQQTRDAIAATRSAALFEETRAAQATRQALDSTATVQVMQARATQTAIQAQRLVDANAATATESSLRSNAIATSLAVQVEQTRAAATETAIMNAIYADKTRTAQESEKRARQSDQNLRAVGVAFLAVVAFAVGMLLLSLAGLGSYRIWQSRKPVPRPVIIEEPIPNVVTTDSEPPPPPPIPTTEVVIMTSDLADQFTQMFSKKFELPNHVATRPGNSPERIPDAAA